MNAAKIKCRNLMVGDWITNRNGLPMQITNVGEDYAYATFEGNEGNPWEFDDKDDQPQPIEITEDILRKNNWKVQGYTLLPNEHYYVKDEGGNYLLLSQGTLSARLACREANDGVFSVVTLPCKYVHQLQQILRLAEMTNMANNFKVQKVMIQDLKISYVCNGIETTLTIKYDYVDNRSYNLADMFEKVIRESGANPQIVIENLKSAFEYD